jgi:predicted permease
LVSGQIALTLLLLTGAGAAMEGFLQIIRTPLGYDPHNVMSVPIPLRENSYTTWAARATYYEELRKVISDVPGVTWAAISSNATPPRSGWDGHFALTGSTSKEQPSGSINLVSPGYFQELHIPLLQGRLWNQTENHNGARLAVINSALARQYFPHGDAIGRALKLPDAEDRPPVILSAPKIADSWLTIIGIVADSRNDGLRNAIKPGIYLPYTLSMAQYTQVLVRSDAPPLNLVHSIRMRLAKFNPDQQIYDPENLESWISDEPQFQQEHLAAWIFGVFAVLALALAAVGLYSVVSYGVEQRTAEFGIRMALGAQRRDVLRAVFASNLVSVGTGIVAGLLLALALGGFLEKWAGGSSREPIALSTGIILLSVVSVIACAIPARHATRIDPMSALRFE